MTAAITFDSGETWRRSRRGSPILTLSCTSTTTTRPGSPRRCSVQGRGLGQSGRSVFTRRSRGQTRGLRRGSAWRSAPKAWGRKIWRGDRDDSDSGAALFATRPFLAECLTATDRDLLVLIKLEHYRESERYSPAGDEPSDRFTHSYSLLLVDRQLRVCPIVPTPADVATVAALDKYSIHDFQKRFTALSKSRRE